MREMAFFNMPCRVLLIASRALRRRNSCTRTIQTGTADSSGSTDMR
jgi:hypothetical protein